MSLLTQQRDLLRLLQGAEADSVPGVAGDPFLAAVAGSPALDMVQDIGLWWREYSVEQWCVLTSALLRQRGILSETVRRFSRLEGLNRHIDEVGDRFLEAMGSHPDLLVATVARFELALIRAAQGGTTAECVLEWECDPAQVVACLAEGRPVEGCTTGLFRTRISPSLPRLFETERL